MSYNEVIEAAFELMGKGMIGILVITLLIMGVIWILSKVGNINTCKNMDEE